MADVVGATIATQGVRDAFGVIGSGNLVVTNALRKEGTHFHHARHEGSAAAMADGYARVSGRVGVCSVHQGPGLTNAMTGIAEAAKSRTPVLVLAGETPAAALSSNFRIDQHDLVESVGAIADRIHGQDTAADDAQRHPARDHRRPRRRAVGRRRPAGGAGRADRRHLATSAPANGLFTGNPFNVGISGGFASPLAAELIQSADVIVAAGASLSQWTTKHGTLLSPTARLIHIDIEPRRADVAILADARAAAEAPIQA